MFKFGFGEENKEENNGSSIENSCLWAKCEAVLPLKDCPITKQICDNSHVCHTLCNEFNLMHFSTDDILDVLHSLDKTLTANMSVLLADENNSDLQTALYEGGSKIWECTFDLMRYIKDNNIHFKGKEVLDLGCGVGLLGLFCLSREASMCTFQDYNVEVLKYFTIPNVMLNDEKYSQNYLKSSSFYSGDWNYFVDTINLKRNQKFDYILTSETIYNRNSYEKLHSTFQNLLKKDGVIYLAAKSYYFGVGGGTALFTEFLRQKNIFNVESCWVCSSGVKREILKITFI